MKKYFDFIAIIGFVFFNAQNKTQIKTATIGFLNVENLWDTTVSADYIDGSKDVKNPAFHRSIPIDSIKYLKVDEDYKGEWSDDLVKGKHLVRYQSGAEEFTPKSSKNYNEEVYQAKLTNESKVISELGRKYSPVPPVVVGMVEVENRKVVEDLVKQPSLAKYDYGVVHYNSYDARGIDVALIYQKKRFIVTNSLKKELKVYNEEGKREYTRDLLVVSGILDGEKVAFFVNHWPSRRGGEAVSLPKRNAAAANLKKQMDSVYALDNSVKLIALGDFNDDPVSPSFKNYLKAVGDIKDLSDENPYYNPMYKMFKNGVATLAYQDSPNLFDQIIYSRNLVGDKKPGKTYTVLSTEVFAPDYLVTKDGQWKGYPFRSWSGDVFTGGYSDHFPVFTVLQREYIPPTK